MLLTLVRPHVVELGPTHATIGFVGLKKAGATINVRRLHGTLVTFTSPESHLVSLSIQSLNEKKIEKKISKQERNEAESSARELSLWTGPDTHLYIPNWLTFTRQLSFLERSDHQSTLFFFYYFFFIFLFFFLFSFLSLFILYFA